MISLLLGMIRTRQSQAITVLLLSVVATAAAVAGPVALGAVDRAILQKEVAGATNIERSVSVTAFVDPTSDASGGQFNTVAGLVSLPGFDVIRAGETEVFGPVADGEEAAGSPTSRLVFRDRICEHVIILNGRCLAGPLEVVVGEDTAERSGLTPGDVAVVQAARYVEGRGLLPDGPAAPLTVVGIYQPRDTSETYWAGQRYFPVTSDGTRREALFVTVITFDSVQHSIGQSSVDTLAPADILTAERVETLPDELERVLRPVQEDPNIAVDTDLPVLVERIQSNRDVARQIVPIAFVPLVGISFFVIFLAVGYAVLGRRQELGVVTLRGVRPLRRWWLAAGETLLMIVAGAPVGYLFAHAAVALVARWRLGTDGGTELSLRTLPYALLALLGALVMALLGQRRSLAEPVVELLRGVPRSVARWQSLIVEGLVLVLAVVATLQLRDGDGGPAGVALLVPGLVVVAAALVAARGFGPSAGLVARVALRRGWLGSGLAAVQIARRPGSQRLFVLLAVATAMLAFVAAGVDVAARARDDRAKIVTGTTTVLTVDQIDAARLLYVTRTVDPDGDWAMAVMTVDQSDELAPPTLAVDSARLPAVAAWRPEFGTSPEAIAQSLRPPVAKPFMFHGTRLDIDIERMVTDSDDPIDINLAFAPLIGGDRVTATLTGVTSGRQVRTVNVSGCRDGCRFVSFSLGVPRGDLQRFIIYSMRQVEPPGDVVPVSALVDRPRWRVSETAQVSQLSNGLQIVANPNPFLTGDIVVSAVDLPLPVPIAGVDVIEVTRLSGLDNQYVNITVTREPAMLPRLAGYGALVDLEYLERTSLSTPRRGQAEVWLGPSAPADAAERMRQAGLAVSAVSGLEQARAGLARQGSALALQFHLAAAVIGIVLAIGGLGLVAAVDRRQRSEDFRSLRRQGMPGRFLSRAAYGGYLIIVIAATLVGLGAAAAAWWAAGDRLPVFTDTVDSLQPPRWPVLVNVVQPWLYAVALLVLAALVAGVVLRRSANGRAVARNGKG